jgi:transcription elongation factor Elf1
VESGQVVGKPPHNPCSRCKEGRELRVLFKRAECPVCGNDAVRSLSVGALAVEDVVRCPVCGWSESLAKRRILWMRHMWVTWQPRISRVVSHFRCSVAYDDSGP